MAAEIGLLSLTQLQKLSQQQQQQQQQPTFYNYAARRAHTSDEDDSWEVRAFVEDTTSAMGTTWPPRSYTCNFCRREFRSAQALGGHMNVHRRDRARLRQSPQELNSDHYHPSPSVANGGFQNYSGEFVANEGLCMFYPMSGRTGTSIEEVRTCEEGGVVEELDLELRLGWGF